MYSLQPEIVPHCSFFGLQLFVVTAFIHIYEKHIGGREGLCSNETQLKKIDSNHLSLLSKFEGKRFSYFSAKHSQLLWTVGEKRCWFHYFIKHFLKGYQKGFIY